MKWAPFEHEGKSYDLSHLQPRKCKYAQAAKGNQPERIYHAEILFSLHCFTRGIKPGETPDPALRYDDDRETRIFDFGRYALSKQLPAIFDNLQRSKCFHTGKSNFLTVELVDDAGDIAEYEIYFTVRRTARKGVLNISVQSAYVRDATHGQRARRKPIGFFLILHNTLMNKPIKAPQ